MSGVEVIDGVTGELVPYEHAAAPANLFGTDQPAEVIQRASDHAKALADVIQKRKLWADIQGRPHVLVEGWTLLGSMLGVFPVITWTRRLENGWEARAEARTLSGAIVGAAEAQCTRDENMWSYEPVGKSGKKLPARDDYALRSMAQTRATSKALRGPLGFIVQLAGYNPTPAEELPHEDSAPAHGTDKGADGRAETTAAEPASDPTPPGPALITDKQRGHLFGAFKEQGMPEQVLRDIVHQVCGDTVLDGTGRVSTKLIPKSKFQQVLDEIQKLDDIPF